MPIDQSEPRRQSLLAEMNNRHTRPNDHEAPLEDYVDVLSMSPPQQEQDQYQDQERNHGGHHGPNNDKTGASFASEENQIISRFKLDTAGFENQFKFPPAPRHAPGHFTNRMIVPRVDGSEKQHSPPAFRPPPLLNIQTDQQHKPENISGPTKNTTQARPAAHQSFIPSPLSAVQTVGGPSEQRTPKKKVTLSSADRQAKAASDVVYHASPARSLPQPRPVGTDHDQGYPSRPVFGIPQASLADWEVALVQPSELHQHMSPMLSRKRSADGQPVSLPLGEATANTEHSNEPKSGLKKASHADASAKSTAPNNKIIVPQSYTQQDTDNLPLANVLRQHVDHMENQRPVQAMHDYQQRQMTCITTDAARVRNRSLSLSGSSGGSGVAKLATASIRNLNKYRDRDLPEVANKVNDLWILCNTAVKEAEKESRHAVEKYRKKLHDRSQRIRQYLETIDVQTQAIQSLEADKQDITDRMTKLEMDFKDYSDMVPKLRDKCRRMQETVDSAIKEQLEQQQLHSQYRKSTQAGIDELRAEKQREQASRELVERQLAAVREQMKERVRQVEMLSQEECRHMNDRLQQLCSELEEKNLQVQREKEISQNTAKQLEDAQRGQETMEVLRSQTAEILMLLSEQRGHGGIEDMKLTQADHGAKMDGMAQHLESLKGLVSPNEELITALGRKQDEMLSKIITTLETVSECQVNGKDSVVAIELINKELQRHIDEVWQHLDNRTVALEQQLDEKRAENDELTRSLLEEDRENKALNAQLQATNHKCKEQEQHISGLERRLEDLEATLRQQSEHDLQNQRLLTENERLQTELEAKSQIVSDLEHQLAAGHESHLADMQKAAQALANKEQSCKAMQDDALAAARQEYESQLQQTQGGMHTRLEQAEQESQAVRAQLEDLKNQLRVKEQEGSVRSTELQALRASLTEAQLRLTQLTEQTRKTSELESQRKIDTTTIQNLNVALAEAQKEVDKSVAASSSHAEKLKGVLENLGNWARARALAYGFAAELADFWEQAAATAPDQGTRWSLYLEKILSRIALKEEHPASPGPADTAESAPPRGRDGIEPGPSPEFAVFPTSSHVPQQSVGRVSGMARPDVQVQQSMDQLIPETQHGALRDLDRHPLPNTAGMFAAGLRRVTVQSPHPGVLTPVPPSVEQEKSQRRGGSQPKPIIKRVTRSATTLEASHARAQELLPVMQHLATYGGFQLHPNNNPRTSGQSLTEQSNNSSLKELTGNRQKNNGSPRTRSTLESQKRGRSTNNSAAVAAFSPNELSQDPLSDHDGDGVPQPKRSRVQKPATRGNSRRGRSTPSQSRKQKQSPGSAAGVVHGSLAGVPGVVHGAPSSSQQNADSG